MYVEPKRKKELLSRINELPNHHGFVFKRSWELSWQTNEREDVIREGVVSAQWDAYLVALSRSDIFKDHEIIFILNINTDLIYFWIFFLANYCRTCFLPAPKSFNSTAHFFHLHLHLQTFWECQSKWALLKANLWTFINSYIHLIVSFTQLPRFKSLVARFL